MPDVALMIQSGYTPRKEWLERHFRVELEEKKEGGEEGDNTTFDPQEDKDLFGSIFGAEGQPGQPEAATGSNPQVAAADLQAAANVMDMPAGATPEESQADADMSDDDIYNLLGMNDEEEPQKPFGNEDITEDEAVNMDK
jgi:hypothetical protein